MKALARYQIILLGEQRHIRCEQLAQGCCPNSAAVGVEPATSRSNHYTTEPPCTLCMQVPSIRLLQTFVIRPSRRRG